VFLLCEINFFSRVFGAKNETQYFPKYPKKYLQQNMFDKKCFQKYFLFFKKYFKNIFSEILIF